MKIPLNMSGGTVAVVVFNGKSAIMAKGIVKASNGKYKEAKRIRELISVSRGLSNAVTTSPSGNVKVWSGFWGWLAGLNVVLPSIGAEIYWNGIEYP